jgi:hypothetical protein
VLNLTFLDISNFQQGIHQAVTAAKLMNEKVTASIKGAQEGLEKKIAPGAVSAGKDAGEVTAKSLLSSLNDEVGKRSTFGKISKLLAGGGVIGGLGIAAHVFDGLTLEAENFALALDKGGDASRKAGAELLTQIPIVGKLGEAGARIWGIVSGETAYVARIKESTAAQEEDLAIVGELKKTVAAYVAQVKEGLDAVDVKIKGMGFHGLSKEIYDLQAAQSKGVLDAKKVGADLLDNDIFKKAKAEISKQGEELNKLYAKVYETPRTISTSGGEGGRGIVSANPDYIELQKQISDAVELKRKAIGTFNNEIGKADRATIDAMRGVVKDTFFEEGKAILGAAAEAAEKTFKPFFDEGTKIKETWGDQIAEMKKQVDTFGMSEGRKRLFDFSEHNPNDQMKGFFKDLSDQYDKLEMHKKFSQDVKQWAESMDGPIDKFREMYEQLAEWRDKQAITMGEFNQGVAAATSVASKAARSDSANDVNKFAPFVQAGSNEAAKFQAAISRRGDDNSIFKEQLEKAKEQVEIQQEIKKLLNFAGVNF